MKTKNDTKDAIEKDILSLKTEIQNTKSEIESLKNQIIKGQSEYKNKFQEYLNLNDKIVAKEKEEEQLEEIKTKAYKKSFKIISLITPDVVLIIKAQSTQVNVKLKQLILKFFGFISSSYSLISLKITKSSDEWKIILQDSLKRDYTEDEITNARELLSQINITQINYPYKYFIEFIEYKIQMIETNMKIKIINNDIGKITLDKNTLFIKIKNLENNINKKKNLYDRMNQYYKEIYSLLEKYIQLKKNIEIEHKKQKPKSRQEKEYQELTNTLNDYQKLNFREILNSFDNINSLTIKSEISDEKSIYSIPEAEKQYLISCKSNILLSSILDDSIKETKTEELKDGSANKLNVIQNGVLTKHPTCNFNIQQKKIISKVLDIKDDTKDFKVEDTLTEQKKKNENYEVKKNLIYKQRGKKESFSDNNNSIEILDTITNLKTNEDEYILPLNQIMIRPSKFFEDKFLPHKGKGKIKKHKKENLIYEREIYSEGNGLACNKFCFFK